MNQRYGLIVLCSAVWLIPARAEVRADSKAAIAYVKGLQTDTGGFLDAKPKPNERVRPTLRATSAAVRALHYLGGELPHKDAVVRFVGSCFDKGSGGFANFPGGEPEVFTTAVGIMAVTSLKMPVEKYADGVVNYLSEKAKTFEEVRIAAAGLEALGRKSPKSDVLLEVVEEEGRKKAAGMDYAREVASIHVTRIRLGEKADSLDKVVTWLQEDQRQDGGYRKRGADKSDLETTYRVMRFFHMLKAQPDVAKVRAFVAKCQNDDGGYGVAPGQPSSVGGTYFAAIITHWLEKK